MQNNKWGNKTSITYVKKEKTTQKNLQLKLKKETMEVESKDVPLLGDESLSKEELQFFEENGYCILHNAVPKENLQAAIDAIWTFLEMDPKDPKDWYRKPATKIGFVELYHHQAFWNNRMYPRIYKAFCQLWNSEKLWVSIDRACLKFPVDKEHSDWEHKGFVHWDMDPWTSEEFPFGLQGVLCLEDTQEDQGGFQCVPGMHKWLREWIKNVPADEERRQKFINGGIPLNVPSPSLKKLNLQQVPAKAGDLIIWRRELAHGNGHNVSGRPRLAQYINMFPAREGSYEVLKPQQSLHPETQSQRIEMWKKNAAPPGRQDTREMEMGNQAAILDGLGKKLLGLELW